HRDPRHGRALGGGQDGGGARAQARALPVAALLRGRGLHRNARQVREARGHDQGLPDDRARRAGRIAGAGVLHVRSDRGSDREGREDGGNGLMASEFTLAILTPERTVFEGAVEYVQVPGSEGYLGVLAHHAALVTALADGTLTVRKAGGAEEE